MNRQGRGSGNRHYYDEEEDEDDTHLANRQPNVTAVWDVGEMSGKDGKPLFPAPIFGNTTFLNQVKDNTYV